MRLNPLHGLAFRVNRIDHAAEPGADQVPQHGPADLGPLVAGPDDRDPLRLEDLVEVPGPHVRFAAEGSGYARPFSGPPPKDQYRARARTHAEDPGLGA